MITLLVNAGGMDPNERLKIAQRILIDAGDSDLVGKTIGTVMVGRIPRDGDTITGFAMRLGAKEEVTSDEGGDPQKVMAPRENTSRGATRHALLIALPVVPRVR